MNLPPDIRADVQERVWRAADELDWTRLADNAKSRWYDHWTADPEIGGCLLRFMSHPGQVRLYIKDALMKRYARARRAAPSEVLRALGLPPDTPVARLYIKPHGCLLQDGRMLCWGPARNWRAMLLTFFERAAWQSGSSAHAVLFTQSNFVPDLATRSLVEDAAARLGIARIRWMSD